MYHSRLYSDARTNCPSPLKVRPRFRAGRQLCVFPVLIVQLLRTSLTCSTRIAPPTVTLAPVEPVPNPDRPSSPKIAVICTEEISLALSVADATAPSPDRQPFSLPPKTPDAQRRAPRGARGCTNTLSTLSARPLTRHSQGGGAVFP